MPLNPSYQPSLLHPPDETLSHEAAACCLMCIIQHSGVVNIIKSSTTTTTLAENITDKQISSLNTGLSRQYQK